MNLYLVGFKIKPAKVNVGTPEEPKMEAPKEVVSIPPKSYDPKEITTILVRSETLDGALIKGELYIIDNRDTLTEVVKVEKVGEIGID